ncbi:MAG: DUF4388 domain-containing protein [Blastocatellia bacterium]|nr:DUF4388 domain-containing protein [Blastocatellia bacterium]
MSLAGTLEELPLPDILQIINLGRRTGILTLLTAEGRFTMSFRDGLVVGATAAQGLPLGQMLVERGLITPQQLSFALDTQLSGDWKPLGSILVQQSIVSYDQLEDVARSELEKITRRILQLNKGNFSFQVAEVPIYGSCRLDPQELLLDQARQHDEQQLATSQQIAVGELPTKGFVLIVQSLGEIALPLRNALNGLGVEVHCVSEADPEALHAAFEELANCNLPALTIVDLAELIPANGQPRPAWDLLARANETASTILTAEYPMQIPAQMLDTFNPLRVLARPLALNLRGTLSPQTRSELTTLIEQVKTLVNQLTNTPWQESMNPDAANFFSELGLSVRLPDRPDESAEKRLLELLHESISQLQHPDETTEVSLLLMRLLAECFDRALFFLVKNDQLIGRGGFGFTAAAEKATAKVRKLRIPLAEGGMFAEVYRKGIPFRGGLSPQWWTRFIPAEVGECPNREAVIYPLRSQGGTIGLIYADNSIHHKPLRHTHVLEIFLFQASIALENLTLRQKLLGQQR